MEQSADQPTQQPEWFENFIANYDTHTPEQGEILQATVIRNDQEGIFLDCGLKREIVVPQKDLESLTKEMLERLLPGSLVPVLVVNPATENKDIEISLSRGMEQQVWEKAKQNMTDGAILSLEVVDHNRGGLLVKYEILRGFVPYSLVPELRGVRNPKRADAIKNGLVGKSVDVKITEVDPDRHRLILSAEGAQAEMRKQLLEKFKKGQVLGGKVVKVVDFGAFVDLGGIDGLIHVSQLSWKKVKHPSEAVKVGDELEVKIIDVDRDRQRIGLSRKALLPGPWQTLADELKAGDYIEGIVTRLVDFGAFAKLPQGVEGLIHTSQIGYSAHQDPQNAIKPGDRVLLKVLDVKPDRKRVALSMRQVPMDRQIAWAMEKLETPTEEHKQAQPPLESEQPEMAAVEQNRPTEQTETIEIQVSDNTEQLKEEHPTESDRVEPDVQEQAPTEIQTETTDSMELIDVPENPADKEEVLSEKDHQINESTAV